MNLLHDLPAYDADTNGAGITTLRMVVEIPKGSIHKYEYNPLGYMTIVRDLHEDYQYPFNYGFIPQTLGGDNDPLDAILFSKEPIASGTVVNCKVLGVIKTEDMGEMDDKILLIPHWIDEGSIDLKCILKYLNTYKYPKQEGTYITQVLGVEEANKLIAEAIENYKNK